MTLRTRLAAALRPPPVALETDAHGRPLRVVRGGRVLAQLGGPPPPAGEPPSSVTDLCVTASLRPAARGPTWTVRATDTATGLVVERQGVPPDSRIGRALTALARALERDGGG